MPVELPVIGSEGWGLVLNAALSGLDTAISTSAEAAAAAQTAAEAAATGAAAALTGAEAAATAAAAAQTTANGKNRVYRQDAAPTGGTYAPGDQWFDTDDGNKLYIWTTASGWTNSQDALIITAVNSAQAAQLSANGKATVYRQPTSPGSAGQDGDIWFDSANGFRPMIKVGGVWTNSQDAAIATAKSTADSAASMAANAQTTADGKNKIFTGNTTPSAVKAGDMWVDTSVDALGNPKNLIKTATAPGTGSWVANPTNATVIAGQVVASQIAAGSINAAHINGKVITADQIVGNSLTSASGIFGAIDAGIITTGFLASGHISTTSLSATDIDAARLTIGVIASDRITASSIAAGVVSASKITAGTLDASVVTVANLNASNIITGTMSGARITAGTITASQLNTDALIAKNFYSAASGSRIIIGPGAYFAGVPRITFDRTGNGAESTDPYLGIEPTAGNVLFLSGGSSLANSGTTSIHMGNPGTSNQVVITAVSNDGTLQNDVTVQAGTTYFTKKIDVSGQVICSGTIISTGIRDAASASGGANLNINTVNGEIRKATSSSRRYKKHIADLSGPGLDPAELYRLPVRQFRFRAGYLDPADRFATALIPGFIAEEVHEVYPAASVVDDNGDIETWDAARLIPPMLALIQIQNSRIAALEKAAAA